MKQGVQVQLRELLGAEEYNRLIEEVIVPKIEDFTREGRISTQDLARLAHYIQKTGAGAIDVWTEDAGFASKHGLSEGGVMFARTALPGGTGVSLCIKEFSDQASYDRASFVEKGIGDHLKKVGKAPVVPTQLYRNPKKRIVIMPNLESQRLADIVERERVFGLLEQRPEMTSEVLRKVIDAYCTVTEEVEAAQLFKPTPRSVIGRIFNDESTLDSLVDASVFFVKQFEADERLARVFTQEIGQRLKDYSPEFIHGDLHTGNVLMGPGPKNEPTPYLIDWERAMFGFMEFDLGKLLTKCRLDQTEELGLVQYAVERKEALRAKRNGSVKKEEELAEMIAKSKERYVLNAVTQDLLTAKRYLDRAREGKSERLQRIASVAYNIALRRMEYAEHSGFVSADLRSTVEAHVEERKQGLDRLSELEYETLKATHHPHAALSQENLLSPSADANVNQPNENAQAKYLSDIRKDLRRRDWRAIAKRAVLAGGLAAAVTLGVGNEYMKKKGEESARRERSQSLSDSGYAHDFRAVYNDLILARLYCESDEVNEERGRTGPRGFSVVDVEWPLKNMVPRSVWVHKTDENVIAAGERYDIPTRLIRAMLHTNTIAGAPSGSDILALQGINLLDPHRISFARKTEEGELRDPQVNLQFGCDRLSRMLGKYHIDREELRRYYSDLGSDSYGRNRDYHNAPRGLIEALQEFYVADKYGELSNPPQAYERSQAERRERRLRVPELARYVIHTVLKGGPTHYDSWGPAQLWILPSDFLAE